MPDPWTTRRQLLAAVAMAILLAACTDDPSDPQSPTSGPTEVTTSIVEVRPTLADEGIPNWVGDVVNLHDLEDGACFNRYSWVQDDRHVELDTRVPCGGPHQHEGYLRTEHPARAGAPWPGDREMEAFARAQCYGAFADFVGEIYELSELELGYLTPSRTDFEHEDARFRGIQCYLLRNDGEEMVGSARDSRR